MTEVHVSGTTDLGQLAGMIADLEGYIERRAAELAVPLADKARAEAAKATEAAEQHAGELQALLTRAEDVNTELRRRLAAQDRQLGAWSDATGVQHPHETRPMKALSDQ